MAILVVCYNSDTGGFLIQQAGASQIAAGAITSGKLGVAAVVSGNIAALAVASSQIAAGTVGGPLLQHLGVLSGKLASGAVIGDVIANIGIASGKLASGAIAGNAIAFGGVLSGHIGANIIATPHILNQGILSASFGALAVGTPHLAALAIVSGKVASGGLSPLSSGKIWAGFTGDYPREENKPDVIPSGLIAMWSGTIANIPAGWVICDGNNSTPNLLAKFVQGVATAATNPGATGGEATHVLTEAEMPSHVHAITTQRAGVGLGAGYIAQSYYTDVPGSVNTGSKGSGSAHQNEPTYYDVAFIMKT